VEPFELWFQGEGYEHKERVLGDDPALLPIRFVTYNQGGSRNQLRFLGCKLILNLLDMSL